MCCFPRPAWVFQVVIIVCLVVQVCGIVVCVGMVGMADVADALLVVLASSEKLENNGKRATDDSRGCSLRSQH